MDCVEFIRRCRRRAFELYSSSVCRNRKVLLLLVIAFPIMYYCWSRLMMSMKPARGLWDDHPAFYLLEYSLENRLIMLRQSANDFSANIQHEPLQPDENSYLPLVGNGLFGVVIKQDSLIHLRNDRVLTLPVSFRPVVWVEFEQMSKSAKALDYLNGIAYSITCYMNDICITTQYYAHRTLPNIFVQDIEVINPASYNAKVYLSREMFEQELWSQTGSLKLTKSDVGSRNESEEFDTMIGPVTNDHGEFYVSILAMKIPTHFYVKPRSKYSWQILTAICETEHFLPLNVDRAELKTDLQNYCVKQLKTALKRQPSKLREDHTNAWQQLWNTGISISYSKAKEALNGDIVNATMYYVLSNVRSPFHEETGDEPHTHSLASLSTAGCYGNIHHTFQATNLWQDLSTFRDVQRAASSWLLTLGKQGCDNLVAMGSLGVMQAMVLSFGSFRFSNQHLEFNMHPKFLHRDYTFRRLQYGNGTQINVTVQLQEDNKAILLVALEKFDRPFYACDGGCLDGPVQLGHKKIQFPVKLTEPVTAILYISPDHKHLDDLRHAIHVHEVGEDFLFSSTERCRFSPALCSRYCPDPRPYNWYKHKLTSTSNLHGMITLHEHGHNLGDAPQAPAHEHGVIALHKHGHHLGGLPTFFWVSVCILIVIFHLFLFKLIYNEYCGGYQEKRIFQDKHKVRYSKL